MFVFFTLFFRCFLEFNKFFLIFDKSPSQSVDFMDHGFFLKFVDITSSLALAKILVLICYINEKSLYQRWISLSLWGRIRFLCWWCSFALRLTLFSVDCRAILFHRDALLLDCRFRSLPWFLYVFLLFIIIWWRKWRTWDFAMSWFSFIWRTALSRSMCCFKFRFSCLNSFWYFRVSMLMNWRSLLFRFFSLTLNFRLVNWCHMRVSFDVKFPVDLIHALTFVNTALLSLTCVLIAVTTAINRWFDDSPHDIWALVFIILISFRIGFIIDWSKLFLFYIHHGPSSLLLRRCYPSHFLKLFISFSFTLYSSIAMILVM